MATSIAHRQECPQCRRSIAVVSGRFARHDPVDRGPILLSCHGSLTPAPMWDLPDIDILSLFDLDDPLDTAEPAETAQALFELADSGVLARR